MPLGSASQPSEADVAFMRLALIEATAALERQEVPIGCVLVDEQGVVVAKGSNRTNEKRDATRHAELEAFDALRAADTGREEGDAAVVVGRGSRKEAEGEGEGGERGRANGNGDGAAPSASPPQLHPRSSLSNLTLYVTCEPCVMCAAALSILKPKRVVFGCHNPRFGGVGSVLDVVAGRFPGCGLRHAAASDEEEGAGEACEARSCGGNMEAGENLGEEELSSGTRVGALPPSNGRASRDDHQFPSSLRTARSYRTLGGVLASEAIALLKEFYETGNPSAPRPNRPAAAAATRAARKAAAAEAAAAAGALAAEAAALAAAAAAK